MSIREEQCNKVCRILDDILANRPTERDSLIVAVRKAFESLEQFGNSKSLPSAQPEIIYCKDCKYFELDHFEKVGGVPIPIIVAHEICMKWGEGCKSSIDGWCFMAERRKDG